MLSVVVLGCTGFASATDVQSVDQAWSAAETQNADPKAQAYASRWGFPGAPLWNDNGVQRVAVMPHDKALLECVTAVFPTPTSAKLVFELDAKGLVTRAFSDQTGYAAECIQSKTVGHRVPPPPTAPFYLCTKYEKRGESGSRTTTCGGRPVSNDCESHGTSTTCRTQR